MAPGGTTYTVEDVKGLAASLIDDTALKVGTCEALMHVIQGKNDILRFRYVPEALIATRATLDRVNLSAVAGSATAPVSYREPANLQPPSPLDEELSTLFQFFRRMHATFWEVRSKL